MLLARAVKASFLGRKMVAFRAVLLKVLASPVICNIQLTGDSDPLQAICDSRWGPLDAVSLVQGYSRDPE